MEGHFMNANNKQVFASDYTDLDDLLNQFPKPLRNHSRRVAVCSVSIAEYGDKFLFPFGTTDMDFEVAIHLGGTCHDIGKMLLPCLGETEKDGHLHPILGAGVLEHNRERFFKDNKQAGIVLDMVRYHHEQPDGKGYPGNLKTADIPLTAAICAIADELDHQVYDESGGFNGEFDKIYAAIKKQSGKKFIDLVIGYFTQAWPRLIVKYTEWNRESPDC